MKKANAIYLQIHIPAVSDLTYFFEGLSMQSYKMGKIENISIAQLLQIILSSSFLFIFKQDKKKTKRTRTINYKKK